MQQRTIASSKRLEAHAVASISAPRRKGASSPEARQPRPWPSPNQGRLYGAWPGRGLCPTYPGLHGTCFLVNGVGTRLP